MRIILFRFISIILLILVTAGCTGGEKPVETSAPETTDALPTTAPPTSAPPTTAPPAPAIDLSSSKTRFEELLPPGYILPLIELSEGNIRYDLRYPAPPRSYVEGIEAKYPPETQTINRPYPYSDSYTIVRKQGSVNILKFKTGSGARNYYPDIDRKLRENTDFNLIEEVIKVNDKSLYVHHKIKGKKYYATLIQKGIFIFQIDPGVETTEDAEAYIIGNMDYLFE